MTKSIYEVTANSSRISLAMRLLGSQLRMT